MCEKCLYKKNCQFLAKLKRAAIEGCTAFESEEKYITNIKIEAIKEFAEKLRDKAYEGYSSRALPECVFISVEDIDNLVKEMGCSE